MTHTFRALVAATCLPLFVGCAAESSDMDTGPTSLEDGIDLAWTGTAPAGTYQTPFNSLTRNGCVVTALKAWTPVGAPIPREQAVTMFLKVDQSPESILPCAAGRVPAYQTVTGGLVPVSPQGANTGRVIAAPGAAVVYVSNLVTAWNPPYPVTGQLVRASMRSLATGAAVGSIADIRCTNGVVTVTSQTMDLATGTLTLTGSKRCITVGIGEVAAYAPSGMWRATYVGFGTNPTMGALPTTFETW